MALRFAFDPNRCTGCSACVVSCRTENRGRQRADWRQVHTYNPFRHPALPLFHLSLACHHCGEPACLWNCPAGAYAKDPATGAVTLRPERCMGCRYCTWACPFDAPKFDGASGTTEKCTFCAERLAAGLDPACAARCPVGALRVEVEAPGDLHQEVPGFPPSDTRPSVRFVPLRRDAPPELGFAPAPGAMAPFLGGLLRMPEARITLKGEWTLLAFTTVLPVLWAWLLAALRGGPALPLPLFLGLGLAAMLLSALHLGRPARAWRALLNLRHSWLSREILLAGAFLGLGAARLLVPSRALAWAAGLAGLAGLLAVDRIYRVALKGGPWSLHSGQAFLNALYLLGLLGRLPALALGAGLLKLALYLHRKGRFARQGRSIRPAASALRLLLGFLAPSLVAAWNPLLAALSALLGDFVDRCEFYGELEVATPQGELAAALRRRPGGTP